MSKLLHDADDDSKAIAIPRVFSENSRDENVNETRRKRSSPISNCASSLIGLYPF